MTPMLFAGLVLLVGGSGMVWSSLRDRKRGDLSWRGRVLSSGALAVYGVLVLSGIAPSDTTFGAVAVSVVAVLVWAGLFLSIRDRRRSPSGR